MQRNDERGHDEDENSLANKTQSGSSKKDDKSKMTSLSSIASMLGQPVTGKSAEKITDEPVVTEASVLPKIIVPKPIKESRSPKPVDKKHIFLDPEKTRSVPALSKEFVKKLDSFLYFPTPKEDAEDLPRQEEDWYQRALRFDSTLEELLKLAHNVFWSTAIYERNLNQGLRSYVNNAPRFYEQSTLKKDHLIQLANQVHKRVLNVYFRLSTPRESERHFLSPEAFTQYLIQTNTFDVPLLMDICAIYGKLDEHVDRRLMNMLNELFSANSKQYIAELGHFIENRFKFIFNSISNELGMAYEEAEEMNRDQHKRLSALEWSRIKNIIKDLTFVVVPLSFFLYFYPTAGKSLRKFNIESLCVKFFENIFINIRDELILRIEKQNVSTPIERSEADGVQERIVNCGCALIEIFRSILTVNCFQPLFDECFPREEKTLLVDQYLDLNLLASSYPNFSSDYFKRCPFEQDLLILMDKSELTSFRRVDPTRVDFLLNSIADAVDKQALEMAVGGQPKETESSDNREKTDTASTTEKEQNIDTSVEMASMVSMVQDIFPDVQIPFVQACLEYFDFSPEKVIDAILNGNLPLHLQEKFNI